MTGRCKACGCPMVSSDLCDRCEHDPNEGTADFPVRWPPLDVVVGGYERYRP